jgi:hypothetical protein
VERSLRCRFGFTGCLRIASSSIRIEPHEPSHTQLIECKMVKNKKVEFSHRRIYLSGDSPE